MQDRHPDRFRRRIYTRAASQRRDPELGKLAMIVGVSMLLAVLWVGLSTETLPGLGYLR